MKPASFLFLTCLLLTTCRTPQEGPHVIAFTGATLIDGNGGEPIPNAVILVSEGKILNAGPGGKIAMIAGAEVRDFSGKFIMPGIINAHGHVGDVKGIEGGHYSAENVKDNLGLYARYGVTTVVSLGGDKEESEEFRALNDSMTVNRARLYIAGEVITGNTPDEGVAIVNRNHAMGVDFMKVRVDDNLGSAKKIGEDVYRAAITRSHELGYKFASHLYYLDDAKKLLDAGSDMMAHSVRDKPVDEEFVRKMKEKKVCYCPTLTRELSTYVYGETPSFFSDPFFQKEYDSAMIKPLLDPARQQQVRESKGAKTYRAQLPTAMANLKVLSDAGVPIVFGTDSGVPTRFLGYFEHMEMAMMAEAGMTPMQIIQSASKNAAECMGLKNVGTLTAGHWADFIVLDADPLSDIGNTKEVEAVFVSGVEVKK